MNAIDSKTNYENTLKEIGYISLGEATQADYDRIGFMSGLEVHQQLLTDEKLFCRCSAGKFQKKDEYDAELLRHMRPTLSELGVYDGTALMEFRTRKEIIYRISNDSACTYDVDDTPPFPINRKALDIAIEISILSRYNIVGEVHITRKQYLDGSIPAGFQRTAIIGVEGLLPMKNKNIRLIQLSIEEDSCREISDIGHTRIYRTDRLGMPLIETVTYPDMVNPHEVKEVCDYIRFLNRSTGKVRRGIGAGRQDVNVSCKGGTRVEIKGVAHTKWIPKLTHIECFRQWALLNIKQKLNARISKENWKMNSVCLDVDSFKFNELTLEIADKEKTKVYAVNLPCFEGILSHFTQPDVPFYDEFSHRLKVIACIERPNMFSSEDLNFEINKNCLDEIKTLLGAKPHDAQILFWGEKEDIKTALEVIEERALMAFDGVPEETRKSFENGTTIFERVLPGADRMYPDTDSAPIPLKNETIEKLSQNLPMDIVNQYDTLFNWGIPTDTYTYIFSKNLFTTIQKIVENLGFNGKQAGTFIGQVYKNLEGKYNISFGSEWIYEFFYFLKKNNLTFSIARSLAKTAFEMNCSCLETALNELGFTPTEKSVIENVMTESKTKFIPKRKIVQEDKQNWLLGQIREMAEGNVELKELIA